MGDCFNDYNKKEKRGKQCLLLIYLKKIQRERQRAMERAVWGLSQRH